MLPRIAYISEAPEDAERRGAARRTVHLPTTGDLAAFGPRAILLDLSETGLRLLCHSLPKVGETIYIELPLAGQVAAHIVWEAEGQCGAEFDQPIARAVVSAAILSSPPRQRPAETPAASEGPSIEQMPMRAEWALLALLPLVLLLLFALAFFPISGFR